jgi:predicted metal-dependent phosphotriesterase family hydrolase
MDTISRSILPMLRSAGVAADVIDQMLVGNPRRLLAVDA